MRDLYQTPNQHDSIQHQVRNGDGRRQADGFQKSFHLNPDLLT